MNYIPVVYATEKDYGCTVVSMISAIENARKDTFYNFYILIEKEFIYELEQEILRCFEKYKTRCNVKLIRVSKIFDNIKLQVDFIKKSTFFRLLIPQLLEEERCIYLDSDTIICTDLQRLFEIDIMDNYIAGVKAPAYILRNSREHCSQALLPEIKQYINAGVLVLNLKEMRKNNVVEKFLELLPFDMPAQDQDIINSVCYNHIYFLPFKYNVMTKYSKWTISEYESIFSKYELMEAWNNPVIIHYADRLKPWKNLNCVMGDYWWNVCKRSDIWEYNYKGIPDELLYGTLYFPNLESNSLTAKKTSVLFDMLYERKIIIFGAGGRATRFIVYLKKHGIIPEFILVSNHNENLSVVEGIEVKELKEIKGNYIGKTLIIATLERYHIEILSLLQGYKFKEIIPLCDKWEL
ncbi:glycosyltransferase family 8 protein [Lachnospiraceae bacterium 56-18]